ncbi:MAG: hypothetical protein M3179_11065 [Actinomycetota bacterium]|nr:hypothetical protein [Actinomycetota bacterium]
MLSRVAAHLAGVRFDSGPLDYAGQILGAGMLREDLLEAITHLHVQPPVFNLFIGLVLQAPASWETPLFQWAFLAMGISMALCLYAVLRRLGVGAKTTVALTLVFMISPPIILYENWLLYDYPVAALLCLAVLALLRYESNHHLRDAALFLAVLAVLVLTRSLFHLAWFLIWAAVLVVHRRGADWKKVLAVAGVVLVPILAVHFNNVRVAGDFTTSSSLGVSLAKITTFQLPEKERRALVASGELSPLALVDPLSPLASYRGLVPRRPPTGVPVLDAEVKGQYGDPPTSHGFDPNLNSSTYLDVSSRYFDDAVRTIRQRPGAYLQGVATAFNLYFRPVSDPLYHTENRERLAWFNAPYNVVVSGAFSDEGVIPGFPQARRQYRGGPGRTAWFAIGQYAVALVVGAWVLWRGRRRGTFGIPRLTLVFLWSTVAYVTVLSNVVEVGENARFRLYSEPLVFVLLAGLIAAWWREKRGSEGDVATQK